MADVEAIHPGYGFLSENAHFAEVCENCNIKFIGPKSKSIEMMGNKSVAKETVRKAGVPIVPGSDGPVTSEAEAIKAARKAGYPITFWQFFKLGFPVLIGSMLLSSLYMWLRFF